MRLGGLRMPTKLVVEASTLARDGLSCESEVLL